MMGTTDGVDGIEGEIGGSAGDSSACPWSSGGVGEGGAAVFMLRSGGFSFLVARLMENNCLY